MNLLDFPEELLAIIIKFLSHKNKLNFACTCHYFHNKTFVFTTSIKFKNPISSFNILQILKKYPNINTIKFDNCLITLEYIPFMYNIKKLFWYYDSTYLSDSITQESHIDPIINKLMELDSLEILVIGTKFSDYLFRPFLTHFSKSLTKLYSFIPINHFHSISFPKLTDLSCRLFYYNKFDDIPTILSNFPKLFRLTLFSKIWNPSLIDIKPLDSFNLYIGDIDYSDEFLLYTNLDKIPITHLHINFLNNPQLITNLKFAKYLKTIKIEYKIIDQLIHYLTILNDSNISNIYFELNDGRFLTVNEYLLSLKTFLIS
jgi:hypothetical protein